MNKKDAPRIVILGGGFGGVAVAQELIRRLPHEAHAQITLIARRNFSVFTPMLTEVVGGELDSRHIGAAIRSLVPSINFVEGEVTALDLNARRVTVCLGVAGAGLPDKERQFVADHLVIALGAVPAYHDMAGLREHSLPIKSLGDAAAIRDRALALLERADTETDPTARRKLLTFVVGGGGYSGVETMAALNGFLRESTRHYSHINQDDIRAILVHDHDRLLPELGTRLAAYAQRKLTQRGVEIRLNTRVTGAGEGWVQLGDERVDTHLLIWTAGVTPNPAIGKLGARLGPHKGLVVDPCLRVPGHPGVWALGDCAEVPRRGKGSYAPTAQNATREGRLAARNIVATLRGTTPAPFVHRPLGQLALVGRRAGVAEILGLHFSGFAAWFLWRAIYLAKLPGLGNRARVGFDWLLDLAFGRQLITPPAVKSRTRRKRSAVLTNEATPHSAA